MAQTYLQLINKVLVALREDNVLGLNEAYTKMIGQFVNDAKEEVEDATAWKALRTEVSFASAANTTTTTLTSTNDRSYVLYDMTGNAQCFRTDSGDESRVTVVPLETLRALRLSSDAADRNEPCYVAFTSNGTNQVAHFWPTPDAVYNYKVVMVVPQDDLEEETDTLTIPWRPVVLRATYLAMDERGSEFAGRLETTQLRAEKALAQAMLTDISTDDWTVVEV
jgi:hypothetical protein